MSPYPQASSTPLFAFEPEESTPDLVQTNYRVMVGGKGTDAHLSPKPAYGSSLDPAAAANLASKNAVVVCSAAFERLGFKAGERGDAVLYETLTVSSKGGFELQCEGSEDPKRAKSSKGDTQQRDTCIASAKHDEAHARYLIGKYNGPVRAKHTRTAVMTLDLLVYGLEDTHQNPTVKRTYTVEIGLVGDEHEFEVLGTHGLVLDTSAGLVFSGRHLPSNLHMLITRLPPLYKTNFPRASTEKSCHVTVTRRES